MRSFATVCFVALLGFGCRSTSGPPAKAPAAGKTDVTTPELVRLLETADIVRTETTHSQTIRIFLNDGSSVSGHYVPAEAGRYAKDPKLSDILNLVLHIRGARPGNEVRGWIVMTE